MKKIFILFAAALAVSSQANAQFIDLVSLGSSSYTIDSGISSGSYTPTASGVTYQPSVALGDSVGGFFTASPLDWSAYSDLAGAAYLQIAITGANPNLPMSLEIFNSSFDASVKYQGTTDPSVIGTVSPYFKFTLSGAFNPSVMASVGGAQITWDGEGSVNATLQTIATVPEPSTYALLALAGVALGGYAARRRKRS